jgi:hypothetical protein
LYAEKINVFYTRETSSVFETINAVMPREYNSYIPVNMTTDKIKKFTFETNRARPVSILTDMLKSIAHL